MWKSQTVADLVLSHSEEVKTIASIASHLNWRRQDRKRCCQSIALTFAVQSSSSSKWMSPPKSPINQGWCFCSLWRAFTKLVGEISMRECVARAVKGIAGDIFSCGPFYSHLTCLHGGTSQTQPLYQPHGSLPPRQTWGWCRASRIGTPGQAPLPQTPCFPACASTLPGWKWFIIMWRRGFLVGWTYL